MEEKEYPIGGYAPGNYHNRCSTCSRSFFGDKQAVQCESCALASKEKFDALSPEEQFELIKKNAAIANEMFAGKINATPKTYHDGYTEGWDAAMKAYRQPGALWVKARELNIKDGDYVAKFRPPGMNLQHDYVGMAFVKEGYIRFACPPHYNITWRRGHQELQYVHILDESGTAAAPTGSHWVTGSYDKLYDQVKGGKRTVCYVDYYFNDEIICRDICTIKPDDRMEFVSRGHGYGSIEFIPGDPKDNFIDMCKELNVEWLCEQPAAGREEVETIDIETAKRHAVAFANWLLPPGPICTEKDYELFMMKPESLLTQPRADLIREVNNRDLGGTAAGREEDAVEFAEWLNANYISIENKDDKPVYVEYGPQEYHRKQQFRIGELYKLFKQQKEK